MAGEIAGHRDTSSIDDVADKGMPDTSRHRQGHVMVAADSRARKGATARAAFRERRPFAPSAALCEPVVQSVEEISGRFLGRAPGYALSATEKRHPIQMFPIAGGPMTVDPLNWAS